MVRAITNAAHRKRKSPEGDCRPPAMLVKSKSRFSRVAAYCPLATRVLTAFPGKPGG
jgi:hypothetical protein